ncbi:MAG: SDR family oxidoreductase [Myxococcota bacterium]
MSGSVPSAVVPKLRETYAGKHIVATGVTGFLGKVWIAMLLDRLRDVRKLTLVIRGKKGETAHERFKRIFESSPVFRPLRQELGQELRTLIADKVEVIDARLVEPYCGMDPAVAKARMADVDAIVHFAGLTDFEPDPLLALDANVHGARHAADLAALTKAGRYIHVSTTFVAGMRSGEVAEEINVGVSPNGTRFDPAQELDELEQALAGMEKKRDRIDYAMDRAKSLGWANIYTYSKGLSEHLLETREDIVQTTFRPAIVECARSYPFAGWNEGINTSGPIVWLLGTSFQRFPAKATNHFDVVPVDTVARSMMLVVGAALRDDAKAVYHCASSATNPLTFERAVDLTALGTRRTNRKSDDASERFASRLDAVCYDPDEPQVLGFRRMRDFAKALRNELRSFDLQERVSPKLYKKIRGEKRKADLKELSMKCRTTDRKLTQVEDMLSQYRPFIHDLRYTFRTDHLEAESNKLSDADRAAFGFDIRELCWRQYWLEVQVPGLEKWSLPLLRGDKVEDDPPLPAPKEEAAPPRSAMRVSA